MRCAMPAEHSFTKARGAGAATAATPGKASLKKVMSLGMSDTAMRELLTCPISLEIMTDPVSCADGAAL